MQQTRTVFHCGGSNHLGLRSITAACAGADHCKLCGVCVEGMDHHCPFVGTCIGRRNYAKFFAMVPSALQLLSARSASITFPPPLSFPTLLSAASSAKAALRQLSALGLSSPTTPRTTDLPGHLRPGPVHALVDLPAGLRDRDRRHPHRRLRLRRLGQPLTRLSSYWHSLSITFETPTEGRGGCSRMTVSSTARLGPGRRHFHRLPLRSPHLPDLRWDLHPLLLVETLPPRRVLRPHLQLRPARNHRLLRAALHSVPAGKGLRPGSAERAGGPAQQAIGETVILTTSHVHPY